MTYLLDTNAWIKVLNPEGEAFKARLLAHEQLNVFLCDVVKAELLYGAYKSSRKEANLNRLRILFSEFNSWPFDGRAADIFGRLRSELEQRGEPIGPFDLQIASIAIANDAIIETHNVREFSRIEGLALENWE
jgi:tRNA(fMet)-specific endonuclease VapC